MGYMGCLIVIVILCSFGYLYMWCKYEIYIYDNNMIF
jgi:hypothetical protein